MSGSIPRRWTGFVSRAQATTINWAGSQPASIEDWTAYLCELTGLEAKLEDLNTRLNELRRRERGLEKRVGEAFFAVYGTTAPPEST